MAWGEEMMEVQPLSGLVRDGAYRLGRSAMARALCQSLEITIAHQSPVGLAAWDRAALITSEAGADFVEALSRWEASGDETDLAALSERCNRLLDSWACAGEAFETHCLNTN